MSPTSYQTAPSRDNMKKEDKGFEPLHGFTRLTVFKTDPFSRTWVFLLDKWWTLQDSNLRPIGYEPIALTN